MSTILGTLVMGTLKNGSAATLVDLPCQVPDVYSLIVTLQREINTLKQKSIQEMENLQKENANL